MEAYILEYTEEDGSKSYYEHNTCFRISQPNHRCLLGDIRAAKAKLTKLTKNYPDELLKRYKIRRVEINIREVVL
jgi:hypothetical protein